jgi:hypothetical protein
MTYLRLLEAEAEDVDWDAQLAPTELVPGPSSWKTGGQPQLCVNEHGNSQTEGGDFCWGQVPPC